MNGHREEPKRIIAIGDIHGEYPLLRKLVDEEIRFTPPGDHLVFLGDYIDRGRSSRQTVEYVQGLKREYPASVILLLGNHEAMARDSFDREDMISRSLWYLNGGLETVRSYGDREAARRVLVPFIRNLDLWYETDSHIFVHAGVHPDLSLSETPEEILLWSRELLPHRSGKTVVVGHTIHKEVRSGNGIVAVDTGACIHGLLSGYDALSGQVYSAG